jgi:proteasome lid subunit RPN8/RPN11
VVPSEDYSHGPPSLRGLSWCEGRKTEDEKQSAKKNTMKTNTNNIAPGAQSRSEYASAEKNQTPALPGMEQLVAPFKFKATPWEYKVTALRECPTPESLQLCDTPDKAAEYWRLHVATHPHFNPECECFVVLMLNTRRRVKGHQLVSIGTMDTILIHPREVFRLAIMTAAAAIVIMHNHPSGEATPSEADIKVTRDLIRAGQLLKIEVLDHVIVGNPNRSSLRELGYFYS